MSATTPAQEVVKDFLEDAPDVAERPALGKLSADQTSLLAELITGFETRREILEWMQKVAMQSLGELPDDWFINQLSESAVVSAFLGRPWGLVRAEDYDDAIAKHIRRDIAAKDLLGAFYDATASFRWSAAEKYGDEDLEHKEIDFDEQSPFMRPAFRDKDNQQAWALKQLIEGFDSMDGFLLWGHYAIRVSYAEIDRETIREAYFDTRVRSMLLGDDEECKFWRGSWAALFLLPAFNRAAATLADRTAERVEREDSGLDAPR